MEAYSSYRVWKGVLILHSYSFFVRILPQDPHSQTLMMGGEGPTEVYIFIPKTITTSEFVYTTKSLIFGGL